MTNKSIKPQLIGLLVIYLLACWVEPCDGHGCDAEVTHVGR